MLLDTGPLLAYLSRSDHSHGWTRAQFKTFPGPFLTCEAVISEACILLPSYGLDASRVLALVDQGAVVIGMSLTEQAVAVRKLFEKYDNVPASLADACLIRMPELHDPCVVLTLDRDFHIYRRHGRQVIPALRPAP